MSGAYYTSPATVEGYSSADSAEQAALASSRPSYQTGTDATDCVHAAAILDIVEELTAGSITEGAQQAHNGAAWAIQVGHYRHWSSCLGQGCAGVDAAQTRLRWAGSFGANNLVTPYGIAAGADGNLWLACFGAARLTVLSPSGELVRHVSLPGAQPLGLFQAGDGTLWSCNLTQPSLTRIDMLGRIVQTLDPVLGEEAKHLRPIQGASHDQTLYLILSNARWVGRRLARLSIHNGAVEWLDCPVLRPSALAVHNGMLYVSALNPSLLIKRSLEGGAWQLASCAFLPESLMHFAILDGRTWLAGRNLLSRLGPSGELEMVEDAPRAAGYPQCLFTGIAVRAHGDETLVYLADRIYDLVHVFQGA